MCDACYTIQKEAWDWEKRYYELLGEKKAQLEMINRELDKALEQKKKMGETIHSLVESIEVLSGKIETMGSFQIPRR